jgi:hypothetical protein
LTIVCATGKLPAGVVATQNSVVTKEKEMANYYGVWFNIRTVASVSSPRREFTVCALNCP